MVTAIIWANDTPQLLEHQNCFSLVMLIGVIAEEPDSQYTGASTQRENMTQAS